jgi:aconitase A
MSNGARRMNHDVMTRDAFSNVQLKNQMVPRAEGGIMPYVLSELISDEPARAA